MIPPSSSSSAEPATARSYRKNDDNDWKFYVSGNPWFIFMNGSISVRDNTTPVDINFDDIWSALHMALMVDVEVQKGDIGFFTDLSWARLWKRQQVGPLNFKTDVDWVLFDFGLYYEVLKLNLASGTLPPRLRLQPFIGGRYQYFGMEIKVRRPILDDRLLTPVSHSAAPILGLRGFLDIDEHWHMSFVGDGGGFGVDGVEKTWQAELLAGYRFRLKYTDLGVLIGYKGVGVDVESDTKDIEGDLIYHGPVLKLALEF